MSYLREIMQRIHARHEAPPQEQPTPDEARLTAHLADYRQRLLGCSPAMLQYEWAWLEEHLATLELTGSRPEMARAAGGPARVQALLEESRRFQELLDQQFQERGLSPSLHRATVISGEHSWELTRPEILTAWGITPSADPKG
jgi:hypothetical protein